MLEYMKEEAKLDREARAASEIRSQETQKQLFDLIAKLANK